MACCIFIFGLIALATWPLRKLGIIKRKPNALAWQPDPSSFQASSTAKTMKLSGHKFSISARAKSFQYAFAGLSHVIRNEHNARIHVIAAIAVYGAAIYFQLSLKDWTLLTLVIMGVFFAEIINTAFEHLCDVVSPEKNQSVKHAKDIAAGAVLISTFGACLIGLMVFLPYIVSAPSPYDILGRS